MLHPEDVVDGALTQVAIERLCGEFAGMARRFARVWSRRYRVELDDLESEAMVQVWMSLSRWRGCGGASVATWVSRGVWDKLRAAAKQMSVERSRLREFKLPTSKFREAEVTLPDESDRQAPIDVQRKAEQVIMAARRELSADDLIVFERAIAGPYTQSEVARQMGVTFQRIGQRVNRIVGRLRESLRRTGSVEVGPKFRRVRDWRSAHGWKWVET